MGRPPTVGVTKVLKIGVDDAVLDRIGAYRAFIEQVLPGSALSDSALARHILMKGLEVFEKEQRPPQHELPLKEATTTKSRKSL